jgi:Mrp family chromosome partitioning ATPase
LSAVSPPTVPGLDAAIPGDSTANPNAASRPAQPDGEPAALAAKPFRPLLEVDRFLWSDECDRFARAVGDQLEGLAEQIAEEARLGRRIVGVASCRRGDGCTTLTLALAPRLVAMGLKVLLVDSDFHNPPLGHRLGLLPEGGWEEILAEHLPLEEVIVESIHDRLALLPLKAPSPGRSYDLGRNPQPRVSLELAAEHYELVLVDVGRFHRHDSKSSNLPLPDGRWLQSLVLLHNVRSTPDEDLTRNRQRVRAAGIREMGIVENFA